MFKGWQIQEYAYSIGAKHMAMIVAYFDESGTHHQSKVISISGLVGTVDEWNRLEIPWKK